MYQITTRQATPAEKKQLVSAKRPRRILHGCLALAGCLGPSIVLGGVGIWTATALMSAKYWMHGAGIGVAFAGALYASLLSTYFGNRRAEKKRASLDIEHGTIQDIHMSDCRVVRIGADSILEPVLVFSADENTLLYLQGAWLWDTTTYGKELTPKHDSNETFNCLTSPFAFPSTAFTVSRFEHSGHVVGIRVTGDYLKPERTLTEPETEFDFTDCELFPGRIQTVLADMAREHDRRERGVTSFSPDQ